MPAGTYNLSTAVEVLSNITIVGAGMNKTIIISSNVNDPSANAGITVSDCGGNDSAVYVNDHDIGNKIVIIQDLTLQSAGGSVFNQGLCLTTGTLFLKGARVTGFTLRGILAKLRRAGAARVDTRPAFRSRRMRRGLW